MESVAGGDVRAASPVASATAFTPKSSIQRNLDNLLLDHGLEMPIGGLERFMQPQILRRACPNLDYTRPSSQFRLGKLTFQSKVESPARRWTLRSIIESVAGGEVRAASPVASATAFTPESGTITTSGGTPVPQGVCVRVLAGYLAHKKTLSPRTLR